MIYICAKSNHLSGKFCSHRARRVGWRRLLRPDAVRVRQAAGQVPEKVSLSTHQSTVPLIANEVAAECVHAVRTPAPPVMMTGRPWYFLLNSDAI